YRCAARGRQQSVDFSTIRPYAGGRSILHGVSAGGSRVRKRVQNGDKLRKGLVEAELLERAARLFAERGYAASSLEDLARETGMSRPALDYYFSSKEDVLAPLVSGLGTRSETTLRRNRREPRAESR